MPKADEKKPKLRIKKPLYISIFIVALFALMILSERLSFFDIFEHKLLDFRFKYFNQELPVSKDIVYIDVDEESIQTLSPFYGGWPWRRGDLIADHIISYIMDCQPSGFFFDMLYVDLTSKDINEDINPQDLELSDITALYQAEDGYVSHAILFEDDPAYREMEKEDIKDNMFGPDVFEITVDDPAGYLKESEYNTVTIPFAELYDYTMHFHSVTHLEDSDGVSRNYRLIIKYKDKCYPSLALAAVIRKMGITKISINNGIMTLLNEETGYKTDLPINRNGIMPLTYYKNIHDFNNIKAVSIVISKQKSDNGEELGEQDVKPEELADKLVIFGGSAIGLKDIKITPMDKNIAGPFIHITAMSNILQNHHLITLNKWLNMLIMLVSIITIIITSTVIKNAIVKNTIGFGYIVAFLAVSMLSFKYAGININISQTLVAAILSYLGALVIVSLTEARDKKFLQSTFGTYLSPEIIDEMFKNKTNPQLGGESRYITAYFTDIQGFSTFSEKLTAAQLVELLNEYLTEMTDTLLAEKGTLDKYEGDAIIAFIGAPMNLPDNPLRACRVAVGMQNKLLALRKKWAAEVQSPDEPNRNSKNLGPDEWEPGAKWPKIVHQMKMRIGINTGDIVVGNMGSKTRMNYTMMGDSVNLAARLEAGAKQYGVYTLVSEFTMNYEFTDENGNKVRVKDFFDYRYIDKIVVVGKSEPVVVYEVVAEKGQMSDQERLLFKTYNQAMKHYLSKEFDEAIELFTKSLAIERVPDGKTTPSEVYIGRCKHFKENPPPENWDGTWVLTSK